MACLCHICSPNYKFDPTKCMWCQKGIKGIGKLNSPANARVCQECMKNAGKLLEEAIKEEAQGK